MSEFVERYFELTPKARLDHLTAVIEEGLALGKTADEMNQVWGEAMVESARFTGWQALSEGRDKVEIDGMEVPAAFSALVRQIEGVEPDYIYDIARVFESESGFIDALERVQAGEIDPRLTQLRYQWVEVLPKSGLNWLRSTL